MLSEIEPELVKDMGIETFRNISEIQRNLHLAGKNVAVIPHGGYVLPQINDTFRLLNSECGTK